MTHYTLQDCHPVAWDEFDHMTQDLVAQVRAFFRPGQEPNVIAPLLRTGGIVGGVLAARLKIIQTLPVQFKHVYHPTRIVPLLSMPDILGDVPRPWRILICEGNTSTGQTATLAAAAIHAKYPDAIIYLATLTKVFGAGPDQLPGIHHIFTARITNEQNKATAAEATALNLRPGITIFPWENPADEVADLNA